MHKITAYQVLEQSETEFEFGYCIAPLELFMLANATKPIVPTAQGNCLKGFTQWTLTDWIITQESITKKKSAKSESFPIGAVCPTVYTIFYTQESTGITARVELNNNTPVLIWGKSSTPTVDMIVSPHHGNYLLIIPKTQRRPSESRDDRHFRQPNEQNKIISK